MERQEIFFELTGNKVTVFVLGKAFDASKGGFDLTSVYQVVMVLITLKLSIYLF